MKYAGLILAFCCGISFSVPAHAADKQGCTPAIIAKAKEKVIAVPVKNWTWEKLYDSYPDYSICAVPRKGGLYDVDLASAYSEAIKYLLVKDWESVKELVSYGDKNAEFKNFVYSFVSSSYEEQELNQIEANAHAHCPSGAKKYCEALESKVKQVEKEVAALNAE